MEERLTRLENLVYALIKRIDNDKFYSNADIDAERIETSNNSKNTIENEDGLLDIADMVDDLESRVEALEEKEA